MELKVNGKDLQIKFNFASLKLWEEKITADDGSKQSDREVFDDLFTGLVQKNPRTLVNLYYGGLAYLGNDQPTYSDTFDAVSEVFAEKGTDEVAKELMVALTANGFFKGSMKQWISFIKKQIEDYNKFFEENKPAKNATKETKEKYKALVDQFHLLLDQSKPVLDELDKMLKDTGTTL